MGQRLARQMPDESAGGGVTQPLTRIDARVTLLAFLSYDASVRTVAASLSLPLGLGFGLPCVFAIRHYVRTGQIWTLMGFPAYGHGPFERIGIETSVPLLVGFLAVCAAEVAVAVTLWARAPYAAAVSYALLPFELVFWIGFALPVGPPLGLARTVLLLLA